MLQVRPRIGRTGLVATGLLALAIGLAGCSTAPPPRSALEPPADPRPASADLPREDPTATSEQKSMVAGWRESYRHTASMEASASREASEPDSVLFFRYQALLAHLDPERIPPDTAPLLHAESEQLRQDVARHRDQAWLRWQADVAPPPEPVPAPEEDVSFSIKPVSNERVSKWLNYFTGPGRDTFAIWYWRSGAYRPRMEEILREEGVPPELVALVFIESGFNVVARSHAAAVGPWQFVRDTGKRYGLTINRHRDERCDFELATRAAARYLKDLYGYFNDWNLALAAYNCGEYRVFRTIAQQGSTDFWILDLPRQTEDYVPEFHAVLKILARPAEFGFSDSISEPLQFDVVDLPGPVRLNDLASHCGTLVDDVKRLNPSWLRNITPADGNRVQARLPKGSLDRLSLADLPMVPLSEARNITVYHKVRRGETLRSIARRYGVSAGALAAENGLSARSRVRTGRSLRLPASVESGNGGAEVRQGNAGGKRAAKESVVRGKRSTGKAPVVKHRYHNVRKGETLSALARRYDRSVSELRRLNGLGARGTLRAGQKLRVR